MSIKARSAGPAFSRTNLAFPTNPAAGKARSAGERAQTICPGASPANDPKSHAAFELAPARGAPERSEGGGGPTIQIVSNAPSGKAARSMLKQSAEVEVDRGPGRVELGHFLWSLRRFFHHATGLISFPISTPLLDKISIGLSALVLSKKVRACGILWVSAFGLLASGCTNSCTDSSTCGDGNVCIAQTRTCAKLCRASADCSGSLLCTNLSNDGLSACLPPGTDPEPSGPTSEDQSLGNQCVSPRDDGVSTATDKLGACGDNAPTCTSTFGAGSSGFNPQTCTVECETDDTCAEQVPPRCIGDCAAQYKNMCCIPRLSPIVQVGQKKDASNNTLRTYCRPRLACYFVAKRCEGTGACPGPRAGTCKPTADGGGECSQGSRALYECCMRNGECDSSKDYVCMPSLTNAAAYCSRNCTTDNDCKSSSAPSASCWTTTLKAVAGKPGKCEVVAATGSEAFCRNKFKPCAKNSPAGMCNPTPVPVTDEDLVDCALDDVPAPFTDNSYDAASKACVYK